MLQVGARIVIPLSGMADRVEPSHEVVGHQGRYLLICPVDKLDLIEPGQDWVPVTRIEESRVKQV